MERRSNRRKYLTGQVISDKMQKTRVVQIKTSAQHTKYPKIVRGAGKYKAHDEKNAAKIGDTVKIMETRRLSKDKRWVIMEIVKTADLVK